MSPMPRNLSPRAKSAAISVAERREAAVGGGGPGAASGGAAFGGPSDGAGANAGGAIAAIAAGSLVGAACAGTTRNVPFVICWGAEAFAVDEVSVAALVGSPTPFTMGCT